MNIAIVGHSGFIGRFTLATAITEGHSVQAPPRFRIRGAYKDSASVADAVTKWLATHPGEAKGLERGIRGAEVVINAAGAAKPESRDIVGLFDGNAVLPGVVAAVAARAGAQRLVHISSAAVQGRHDPLDETSLIVPFSPYSRSKAAGERILTQGDILRPPEIVVYRPTSVQSVDRQASRQLVAFASKTLVPIPGDGAASLPTCLIENVVAGILHVALAPSCPPIVLQPWEGITTRILVDLFGDSPRVIAVPCLAFEVAVSAGRLAGTVSPRVSAIARRVELFLHGQHQTAHALAEIGFVRPVDHTGYSDLARQVRGSW